MSGSGKLHLYAGDGKGKTTSAIGLSIRMLGAGREVAFIQFDKGHDPDFEHYSERQILRKLSGLHLHPTGCKRFDPKLGTFRFGVEPRDLEEARRGLALVRRFLEEEKVGLLVADEICTSIFTKLIEEKDVLSLIDLWEAKGRSLELVFTGRNPTAALLERADLVSEMKKIKHYFDQGLKARPGVEY